MKKLALSFLLISIFFSVKSFPFLTNNYTNQDQNSAKSFIALYTLSYRPDSNTSVNRNETMRLLINNNTSCFQSLNSYLRDSTHMSFTQNGGEQLNQRYVNAFANIPISNFQFIIIKTISKTDHYDRMMFSRRLYLIRDSPSKQEWHVLKDFKKIAGYNCQKATCTFAGREYEAWFTREIPVSEGPYKFRGLPGLILSINDTKDQYSFQITRISTSEKTLPIATPTLFSVTDRKNFEKGLSDYQANIPSRVASIENSPDKKKQALDIAKNKLKQYNNKIEIK